ncbi:Dorsal-ventral patterning protein Sog [Trachymyrmex septentrionalis]|uniref:Dorsal-ventral patterning protein Sog n=1 Tax=Trachymyrmex septentrionalis TaxID=34720 RepID=A0A195ESB3_9HYME|nr:PREDICTED: dorsal-ventral patterning protein Sog [Trachymyrmex septentrionalis]XP_018354760.1 PREDICTED: dorsal-ventral patterning protein Sog [Trachymyrmex septentrionalis]KYN31061.1 Dorsal-ventral patterning protein Sog [Trachymyrmex septentrionalis]
MQLHGGLMLPILFIVASCPLTLRARKVAPLIEDDWARRPHRAAECTFGKQIRELGSTWFADLGPPFGVMYCIKCECIPVQKKRRIIARVQCRNIKNECPKLTCDEPVLLPGRCCKSCPGDFNADIAQDLPPQLTSEEEERSLKHFGTLLTGRTSQSLRRDESNPTSVYNSAYNYLATGRFTFHRKNIYYAFYLSASTPRPRSIQFVDGSGNILEEQTIDPIGGAYQNTTGKLCGVWRRVPRDYRKLLREERLHVSFLWEPSSSLTGQLSRYRALSTEQFSALLEPAMGVDRSLMSGAGATAIVSASSASAPSIHVSLVFNGLFLPNDVADVPLIVQLEHHEKDHVVLREEIIVRKPSNELNYGEVRSALSGTDLRLLTRGKLLISIISRKDPQALRLIGMIGSRATCDMYQTLLLSETPSVASGLAWVFLDRVGALRYGVQLIGLEEESPLVTLVDEGGKRRMELEDLTPSLIGGSLANGSLDRPGPRLLQPLFNEELSVVAASHVGSLLRGRLLERPVADARDTAAPVLLRRLTKEPTHPGPVGLIWTAVDLDCSLHYELELAGFPPSSQEPRTFRLYLETMPMLAQGAPVARRLLEEFTGYSLEGSVTGLSSLELYRIESGIGFLEVTDKQVTHILKAPFKARAPFSCLPHYADNDVTSVVAYNLQPPRSDIETGACFHETRFYEEGTQWTSNSDPCSMCHCYRGLAQCDTVPCPTVSCGLGKQLEQPPTGHCCPICADPTSGETNATIKNNATRGCTLAGQYHLAGSSWHPYLPPAGFDTCAVCTCDAVTLEVKCPLVQCPPLECDEKIAVRLDKKACCRQCPPSTSLSNVTTTASSDTIRLPRDQALPSTRRTAEEILSSGGCKYPFGGPYENGMEWHPRLHSHGEVKCVKCRCKNGEVRCDRKRCPRSLCNSIAHQMKRGEHVVDIDDCCTAQCEHRARRHHRNNHHPARRHSMTPRELS